MLMHHNPETIYGQKVDAMKKIIDYFVGLKKRAVTNLTTTDQQIYDYNA